MDEKQLWEKCGEFHGHHCGGLAIGLKAAIYAMELLDLSFSEDEDVVCITENDAYCVDAIQVILGCSVGKGNLLFKMRGKEAFSFFNRKTGRSVRLVLRNVPGLTRAQSMEYFLSHEPAELFDVKDTVDELPIKARLFKSIPCDCCGEMTMDTMMHMEGDKKLCKDCFVPYSRFLD